MLGWWTCEPTSRPLQALFTHFVLFPSEKPKSSCHNLVAYIAVLVQKSLQI